MSRQPSAIRELRESPSCIALAAAGVLVLTAGLLMIAGCATTPLPPTQAAMSSTEQARVADYASAELTTARQKLASANTAARADPPAE